MRGKKETKKLKQKRGGQKRGGQKQTKQLKREAERETQSGTEKW